SAWIRFSSGAKRDDSQRDAHGMAVKLMGVPGEKILDGERHAPTQDFVMVDNPVFFIRNALDYAAFSEALQRARGHFWIKSLLFFLPQELRELIALVFLFFLPRRLHELRVLLAFASKTIASPL